MTHQDGYDAQLQGWLEDCRQETLLRIHRMRHETDDMHGRLPAEPWWTEHKPMFQAIAEPAAGVTAHLGEIGRTDLAAYHAFDRILSEVAAQADDLVEQLYLDGGTAMGTRPSGHGEQMFWAVLTAQLVNWEALLHSF